MEEKVNMKKQKGDMVKRFLPFYLFTFHVDGLLRQQDVIGCRWRSDRRKRQNLYRTYPTRDEAHQARTPEDGY